MQKVSGVKQLGIVLGTQLGLMAFTGVGVFGVDYVMSAEPEYVSHTDHSACDLTLESESSTQPPTKALQVRGSSFKFLAF